MSTASEHEMVCFYCEMPLTKRHEHDHYPVPEAAGGSEMVPACMTCHDAKDRIPLDDWPLQTAWRAQQEIFEAWPMDAWVWVGVPPVERLPPGPARVLFGMWMRLWHVALAMGLEPCSAS